MGDSSASYMTKRRDKAKIKLSLVEMKQSQVSGLDYRCQMDRVIDGIGWEYVGSKEQNEKIEE
jgi:hypothetical protein